MNDNNELTVFSLWIDRYRDEIFAFVKRRVKCSQTAADLTQETLLRLHTLSADKPVPHLHALAFNIARNLTVDFQRKQIVRGRYIDSVAETEQVPSSALTPELSAIEHEKITQIQSALHELPEVTQRVFTLHGIEGLSYLQIAEQLGISKSMVAKHLTRAILHCKYRMNQ